MKILFISHTAAGGPFVVGSHHISRALARSGHYVVHLSPPITPAHLLRVSDEFDRMRFHRWRRGGDQLKGVVDIVPAATLPWALVASLSRRPHEWFAHTMSSSVRNLLRQRQMAEPDLIFIDEPRLAGLVGAFPGARVVYRPTDLYAKLRADPSIVEAERFLIKRAIRFIASSEPVAEHLRALGATGVLVIENGVDLEHFSADSYPEDLRDQKLATYVGSLDHRFGFDVIETAASENSNLNFELIGPITAAARARLSHLKNVRLVGAIAFDELPRHLARASIGLLPLSQHASNEGRSPMKLFEYAAMGLPVVATHTSELARRNLGFVSLAATPGAFSSCLAEWKSGTLSFGDCRAEAAKHGWAEKAQQALQFAMGN